MIIVNKFRHLRDVIRQDYELYKKVKPCMEACSDELSKKIMKIRLNYFSVFISTYRHYFPWMGSPYYRYHKKINSLLNPIYIIEELEKFSGKSLVVFGNGDGYMYTISVLERSDWRNNYRCIGNSYDKLSSVKRNEIIVLADFCNGRKIEEEIHKKYPDVQIYRSNPIIWAIMRNQYFDVFEPEEEEYVIDCGAFDGKTDEMFYRWGAGRVKKIYAFELDPFNKEKCLEFYKEKGLDSIVEFINKGTANINDTIHISDSSKGSAGSRIGEGDIEAQVVKIDDEIKGKVTFIKMDVEGAELDSLKGASQTIQIQKPRLAICLYHKQSDIFEIPTYLLSLVPEYKFMIRHYSSNPWETVLYAYVPER